MEEIWLVIEDFPNYSINNFGDIVNRKTERILKRNLTRDGSAKVNLMHLGVPYTRSVKVLVAEAFVIGRTEDFNTPILLDGDQENIRADNIIWRPRLFALKYTHQLLNVSDDCRNGPIEDLTTGIIYKDVYEAAIINGLIFKEILYSTIDPDFEVFPTLQRFKFIRRDTDKSWVEPSQ